MDNKTIQAFDPSALMKGVRDRIKSTFVSLIPDEQWEQMVKKEVDDFLKETTSYSSNRANSEFRNICNQELTEYTKLKLKEILNDKYISSEWINSGVMVKDAIQEMVTQNMGTIMKNVLGSMVQNAVNNMASYN